jgi:hypothetical protein
MSKAGILIFTTLFVPIRSAVRNISRVQNTLYLLNLSFLHQQAAIGALHPDIFKMSL